MTHQQTPPPPPEDQQPPKPGPLSRILGWAKAHKVWTTVIVVIVIFLAIGALGPGATPDDTTNTPDVSRLDTQTPDVSPSDTQTAPTESPTETPRATCTLKGKQTAKVTLEDTGDGLIATFDGQPVPDRGTVLYSVTAWDEAGEFGVQLGMKFLDGEQIGYFVFDFVNPEQTNLDGSPEVAGKTVRGTFPADALGDLGDAGVGSWSAAFNVNGDDVGICPGGIGSPLLPFPG